MADDLVAELSASADVRSVLNKIFDNSDWNQITLAKALKTSQSRVSRWLKGEKPGSVYRLRLVEFINKTFPAHILGGTKKELSQLINILGEDSIKTLLATARSMVETEAANRLQQSPAPATDPAERRQIRHKP